MWTSIRFLLIASVLSIIGSRPLYSQSNGLAEGSYQRDDGQALRIATFNVSMYRDRAGQLAEELATGTSEQARAIADVIRAVRPDVLFINEIDYQPDSAPLNLMVREYLAKPTNGEPMVFPYQFSAPVNTGVASGLDLDHDGKSDGPGDSLGYGAYPGQYGMAVLSRIPIQLSAVRSFQNFRWRDMPGALLPVDPVTGQSYFDNDALRRMPVSSKSHWDVPLQWGTNTIHLLVCHPTPPVFDGPEDRNGRRNHDEIRLWADYVDSARSGYLLDDHGGTGGLVEGASFVIAGDLNADPNDGDSHPRAIRQLLEHPLINSSAVPTSRGGASAAREQGKRNLEHRGNPSEDTGDFSDEGAGNLRVDYLLPSRQLGVIGAGVYWPAPDEPGHDAARTASDHRLVWIDVQVRGDR